MHLDIYVVNDKMSRAFILLDLSFSLWYNTDCNSPLLLPRLCWGCRAGDNAPGMNRPHVMHFLTGREVDNTTLVFYEPVVHGTVYTDAEMGSGFDHVPGGEAYRDRSVYSWHYYCWFLEFIAKNASDAEREEAKAECNTELLPSILK